MATAEDGGQKTRSVSCEAGAEYVFRLKALAALRGQSMGALVRSALDLAYGPEMERLAAGDAALKPHVLYANRKD
jgi:hypothetical protein